MTITRERVAQFRERTVLYGKTHIRELCDLAIIGLAVRDKDLSLQMQVAAATGCSLDGATDALDAITAYRSE